MKADDLYGLAEARGHTVMAYDLPTDKSLSMEDGGCYIGLDFSLRGHEEKERLAHELGHCEYGGFYNRYSACDVRGKAERRADKWSFVHLTPLWEIKKALADGLREPWELAEHFNVSCRFMVRALEYYQNAVIA